MEKNKSLTLDLKPKEFNLGYFIKKYHLEKAFALFKLQLDQKTFTYKTIDFEIYRNEFEDNFNLDEFYDKYIVNDLLYNYKSLFYNLEYTIPKGVYGVRSFNFTSVYGILIYYALGFYIYELIKDSIPTYKDIKSTNKNYPKTNTYCGVYINYLEPEKSNIYYYKFYSEFNLSVKNKINLGLSDDKKVCVLKLDISDFFKSINYLTLCKLIERYTMPSQKKKLYYSSFTQESIINLLTFFSEKDTGLPLSSQNVMSNFISHIYLIELDNYIQNTGIYKDKDADLSYIRYVDDFYLIFYQSKRSDNESIGNIFFEISSEINDYLSKNLSLKINHHKSSKWIIENSDDFNDFINEEKFISFSKKKTKFDDLKDKFELIIEKIKLLKLNYKNNGFTTISNEDSLLIKEIFSQNYKEYINSDYAKKSLDEAFLEWNPILTLNSVKAIMYMLNKSNNGLNNLRDYFLINLIKKVKNSHNLFLLDQYINTGKYGNDFREEVLAISNENSIYLSLIQRRLKGNEYHENVKPYIVISDDMIKNNDSLIQQIKMLVISEKERKYNVAFNHLLNIFHLFCYESDSERCKLIKEYNQNNIHLFLLRINASFNEINFSKNIFDRRNKNNISHAGEELLENWIVSKDEFCEYFEKMNHCIKMISDLV